MLGIVDPRPLLVWQSDAPHSSWPRRVCMLPRHDAEGTVHPEHAQVVQFPSERRDVDTLKMWVKTVAGS